MPDIVIADDGGDEGLGAAEPGESTAMRSADVLEVLVDLLPLGQVLDEWAAEPPDEGPRQPAAGGVVYDDGDGAGLVVITVDDMGGGRSCDHPDPQVRCVEQELDDGSVLWTVQGPVFTDGRQPDLLMWSATLARPDGLVIEVQEHNSVSEKEAPVTRPEPPLSIEELTAIVTSDRWQAFEVDPERQREGAERLAEDLARGRQFAADLGDGWTAPERPNEYDIAAVPTAENAAALPDGDVRVSMLRDSIGRAPEFLDKACQGMTEKGREWDACLPATSPDGETVWLQWTRSVDDTQSVPTDGLTAMYEQDDETVIRVMLSVSQPVEESTPDRREAVVEWIETQVDAMTAAATLGGIE